MRRQTTTLVKRAVSAAITCALIFSWQVALADPLRSTNYQLQETTLGGVGNSGAASTNYQQAQGSGGTIGNTNSASGSFQINAGNTTTSEPTLSFAITSANATFSSQFSPATPATATATFQVGNYTSFGYVVQVIGNPPTYSGHSITPMAIRDVSQVSTEQFGINLVANTSPTSVGANPNQGQFGSGLASSNYNLTNNYRYVSGETIATGPKSGGLTDFTITYLVNVSGLTPAGTYTSNQTLICTGTY